MSAELKLSEYEQWRKRRDDAVYGFVGVSTAIVRGAQQGSYNPDEVLQSLRDSLQEVYTVLGWDWKETGIQ